MFPSSFSIGRVLSRSFSIFGANFVPFCLLTGLIQLPEVAIGAYPFFFPEKFALPFASPDGTGAWGAEGGDPLAGMRVWGLWMLLLLAVSLLLRPLAAAAVTYGVLQQCRGQHADPLTCLRVGLQRALPVLLVALVAGILTLGGSMLCCIPGIIVQCGYYVAMPAAVVERLGVIGSLSRSWSLTEGSRWHIFGIIVILGVIGVVVDQAVKLPFDLNPVAGRVGSLPKVVIYVVISSLVGIVFQALNAVTAAVAYHDLRTEREGASSEQLARVFD